VPVVGFPAEDFSMILCTGLTVSRILFTWVLLSRTGFVNGKAIKTTASHVPGDPDE
jgi:hypothetical protein